MKSDNYVDELDAILKNLAMYLTSVEDKSPIDTMQEDEEAIAKTIRQIEDFYRNKILEMIKKPTTIPKTNNAEAVKQGINFYHKTVKKRITAQFNSKGDNDD